MKEFVYSIKRNICDRQKTTQQCTQAQRITEDKVTAELRTVREECEKLRMSVTDLKARSMRDNLVFAWIIEDNRENTEAILQEFLQLKYKQLHYEIPFEWVLKMGGMEWIQQTPSEYRSQIYQI